MALDMPSEGQHEIEPDPGTAADSDDNNMTETGEVEARDSEESDHVNVDDDGSEGDVIVDHDSDGAPVLCEFLVAGYQ